MPQSFQQVPALLITVLLLLGFSPPVRPAVELQLVDQRGQPVENAVVSMDAARESTSGGPNPIMDQVQKQFVPHVLVIEKGQAVEFPNSDDIRHHVYSFSRPKAFEIRLFKGSEAEPVVFDEPGIVVLGCNIHDRMLGFIYIAVNEATALTGEDGRATLDAEIGEARIWHPNLSADHTRRTTVDVRSNRQTVTLDLLEAEREGVVRKFKFKKLDPGGD